MDARGVKKSLGWASLSHSVKRASPSPSPRETRHLRPPRQAGILCWRPGWVGEEGTAGSDSGPRLSTTQILISADDEMEESDVEEDLRRLTPLKSAKKKKHRFGLPV